MFWKLSFRQPSSIDTLLDKENLTLGEILEEGDVLQECKTQNRKLVDFLTRPEILEELVNLVSHEPPNNVDEKVRFKYPHLACELLTSDVYAIVEALSTNDKLLQVLWSFLDLNCVVNPLVGSFVSKVIIMLLLQKPTVIAAYIKNRTDFLPRFMSHLGTSAIMDLLLQLVAVPEGEQTRLGLAVWLRDQGVIESLVEFIRPSSPPDHCVNAAQALCEMIRVSRETAQILPVAAPLLQKLESGEIVQAMLNNMFSAETGVDTCIINGVSVLLTVLEKRSGSTLSPTFTNTFPTPGSEQPSSLESTTSIDHVLRVVVPRLQTFHNLLTRTNLPLMLTTMGTLIPPLGNTRLQVIRLFAALLQCNDTSVVKEIIRLNTLSVLLNLFLSCPWNNFLHTQVEICVSTALQSTLAVSDGGDAVSLKQHLLRDCQLVEKILQGAERNNNEYQPRQGYMGHLLKIVNCLVMSGDTDEQLRDVLKTNLSKEMFSRWSDFLSGPVADQNKKNDTNLGGNCPLGTNVDDSDDEFDPVNVQPDNELEKAFSQYQDAKYVNTFVEDFGVEDEIVAQQEPFAPSFSRLMDLKCEVKADEQPSAASASFEVAWSMKIQQFDDSESDEEESNTWTKEVSYVSAVDQQSLSSDDEEFERRKELASSSDDEDQPQKKKRDPSAVYNKTPTVNSLSKITSTRSKSLDGTTKIDTNMEITPDEDLTGVRPAVITTVTDEDLTGVRPMDTSGGFADWTKEGPMAVSAQSPGGGGWADFSTFPSSLNDSTEGRDLDEEHKGASPQERDTTGYRNLSANEDGEDTSPLDVGSVKHPA
eukprot:Em0021g340a